MATKHIAAVIALALSVLRAQGFIAANIGTPFQKLGHFSITAPPRPRCAPPVCVTMSSWKDALDVISTTVTTMGGVVSFPSQLKKAYETFGPTPDERLNTTAVAVAKLHNTTVPLNEALSSDKLIRRDCVLEFQYLMESTRIDEQNPTLLVYGPRGVGKTSVVAAALQDTSGVLYTSYESDGSDFVYELEQAALQMLFDDPSISERKHPTGFRLKAILKFYKLVHEVRPIIVVDINSQLKPAALTKVLLATKQLGFEEKLATFVFVISASRSALGMTIGLQELRAKGYSTPDFNRTEAQRYLEKRLPYPEVAVNVTNLIGQRAFHLVEVCGACKGATSAMDCLERAMVYRLGPLSLAGSVLESFIGEAKGNAAFNQAKSLDFWRELMLGTRTLREKDARRAFGFASMKLLLGTLAENHAFAVDPFTGFISMQSHFMKLAIEDLVESEERASAAASREKQQQQAASLITASSPTPLEAALSEVAGEIKKVEQRIDEVERQVEEVRSRKEEGWQEEVAALRKKEEQLRREKEQLRKEKEQLRKEKEQLREEKLLLLKRAG